MERLFHYRLRVLILFFGLILFGSIASAAPTEENLQVWAPVFLDYEATDKWTGTLELQPRVAHNISDYSILIVRPTLNYKVTPKLTLGGGYLWMPDFQTHWEEHRIFQQAVYTTKFRKAELSHQVRLEERFPEGDSGPSLRSRYLLRLLYPFKPERWYGVLSNELFVNLTNTTQRQAGFDQNRAFVGLRRQFKSKAAIEVGYLLQFVNSPAATANQLNHVVLARLNLPLKGLLRSASNENKKISP